MLYTIVLHKKTSLLFLEPKFTLWYLLALCFWRIFTPYVKKIPHYMLWTVIAGLLIGCSSMKDGFLTIPRALVFYPFYLAGTNFQRETITRLRSGRGKLISALCILSLMIFLTVLALKTNVPMQIFYGRYSYQTMKQGMLEGLFWRIGAYTVGTFWTLALLILLPEKKNCFSYIGTRTMAVYLFHGLIYTYLNQSTGIFKNLNTPFETMLLLIGCAAVTVLFSLQPFTTFTNKICRFTLPHKKGTA